MNQRLRGAAEVLASNTRESLALRQFALDIVVELDRLEVVRATLHAACDAWEEAEGDAYEQRHEERTAPDQLRDHDTRENMRLVAGPRAGHVVEVADPIAGAIRKTAGCVVGVPCARHAGQVHGAEAEELRIGLAALMSDAPGGDIESNDEWCAAIRKMVDGIDARDSAALLDQFATLANALREACTLAMHNIRDNEPASKRISELFDFADGYPAKATEPARPDPVMMTRDCGRCDYRLIFGTPEEDREDCPSCGSELNPIARVVTGGDVERTLMRAAQQDVALVAQARIVAMHWMDQDGINGAELDKLARIVNPAWTVMPPIPPPGPSAARRKVDEHIRTGRVVHVATGSMAHTEGIDATSEEARRAHLIDQLQRDAFLAAWERFDDREHRAAEMYTDYRRRLSPELFAKIKELTRVEPTPERPSCSVCGAGACARMTGRFNDCSDPCGHDFEQGDGQCTRCSAILRGQLDRFGGISRSTVTSPYDGTIRWETDAEMLRRGATQRDLERIGP